MKTVLIAAVITGAFAFPAFAAESTTSSQRDQGQTVAQKKAEITQHIEERITNSIAEKECVQSAQTHDALQACREQYRPQQRWPQQRGGQQSDGQQGRREQPM